MTRLCFESAVFKCYHGSEESDEEDDEKELRYPIRTPSPF